MIGAEQIAGVNGIHVNILKVFTDPLCLLMAKLGQIQIRMPQKQMLEISFALSVANQIKGRFFHLSRFFLQSLLNNRRICVIMIK